MLIRACPRSQFPDPAPRFSEEILLFTGESEEIAHLAGEYIRVFLFGLWAIVVYEPLKVR